MILACPICRGKLSLPEDRVPQAGAWARCPRCGDRFYLAPRPPEKDDGPAGPEADARTEGAAARRRHPKPGRAAFQALSPRLGPAFDISQVTVFPEAANPRRPLAGLGPLALLLLIAAVSWLYFAAAEPPPLPPAAVLSAPAYEREQFQADLSFLIKAVSHELRLDYQARPRGPEERVFRHFMAALEAPPAGLPAEISLRVSSSSPERGLTLTAAWPSADSRPSLVLDWPGAEVVGVDLIMIPVNE